MTDDFGALKSTELGGLIDEPRLGAWLDTLDVSPESPLRVRRISGGLSNESEISTSIARSNEPRA